MESHYLQYNIPVIIVKLVMRPHVSISVIASI
jgi:hypothetical protein